MNRRTLSIAVALSMTLLAGAAHADPTAQDQAAAEGLFSDAKRLIGEGNYAAACPKFEESQRLDPAPGTQFKLGECYELLGRTASAWALFLNVAALAKSAGMTEREQIARERAAALEPKLAKLTITVTPTPGLEVKRDGVLVGQAQWGSSVAIDPGAHAITASAPGKETWTSSVDVKGELTSVMVPALIDAPQAPVTPAHEASVQIEPQGFGTQRTLALVAGGVGVVGIGLGTIFGLNDMSKLSDAENHCTGNACDAEGVALRKDAVAAGNIATIAFTVGIVAVVGAAVLWFTAPSRGSAARTTAGQRSRPAFNATGFLGGTF